MTGERKNWWLVDSPEKVHEYDIFVLNTDRLHDDLPGSAVIREIRLFEAHGGKPALVSFCNGVCRTNLNARLFTLNNILREVEHKHRHALEILEMLEGPRVTKMINGSILNVFAQVVNERIRRSLDRAFA